MKRLVLCASVVLMVLTSCSKKTHPSVSNPPNSSKSAVIEPPGNKEITTVPIIVTPVSPTVVLTSPLIVIDGTGEVINSRSKLPPEIASKVDYNAITRSYTPAQKQNLIFRFKMLPPRVLYVPDRLVSKSARGFYCVYKKKFWYWKKEDGLFYLDETYYQ